LLRVGLNLYAADQPIDVVPGKRARGSALALSDASAKAA
jgi:hypothetical protein